MSADHQTLIAEALSWVSGEMTRWRDDAHPDHNRWSWKGDGHGSVIRDEFREQAAALLDSPEFAAVLADVRAGALTDAANAWTSGAWSDVMLPKPTPPAVPVIAYSNRMGDWLRDRADREGER